MIRAVLIDVDNTLLDFDLCAAEAIRGALDALGLPARDDVLPTFYAINDGLWQKIETGELTREELYATRWNLVFAALAIHADGLEFERQFGIALRKSHIPVEGAPELLRYLARKYPVYVASNSLYAQQENRLALAGMLPFLTELFTSVEIGFAKPDPRFFDHCIEKIGIPREDVLLIGDSLTADVRGGLDSGIPTCWYNHRKEALPEDLHPTYLVDRLEEIRDIL